MKPEPQKVLYSKALQGSNSNSTSGSSGAGLPSNMSSSGPNLYHHKSPTTGGNVGCVGGAVAVAGGGVCGSGASGAAAAPAVGGPNPGGHFHGGNSPRMNMNAGNMRGMGKNGQQSSYSNRHNQVYRVCCLRVPQ